MPSAITLKSPEKAEVQELRDRLPHHQHIMYGEIELLEPIGSGGLSTKYFRLSPFYVKPCVSEMGQVTYYIRNSFN